MNKSIMSRIIRRNEEGSDTGGSTPPPQTEPPKDTPPEPTVETKPSETDTLRASLDALGTKVQGLEAQLQELTSAPPPQTDPKPTKRPWTHRGMKR